jgi:Fic family protein
LIKWVLSGVFSGACLKNGNGRLSRTLTTLLLLRSGYAYVPFSSLESVIERNKEAYYLALRRTQGTIRGESPDWQPWLAFFLRSLHEQMRILDRKLEREKTVLADLPAHSLSMVEFVREHGRMTLREAVRLTGANRNTLKAQLRALVERGHLRRQGEGRGSWYMIP